MFNISKIVLNLLVHLIISRSVICIVPGEVEDDLVCYECYGELCQDPHLATHSKQCYGAQKCAKVKVLIGRRTSIIIRTCWADDMAPAVHQDITNKLGTNDYTIVYIYLCQHHLCNNSYELQFNVLFFIIGIFLYVSFIC